MGNLRCDNGEEVERQHHGINIEQSHANLKLVSCLCKGYLCILKPKLRVGKAALWMTYPMP